MMKIDKNKIVFGSVLLIVVIFLASYSFIILGDDKSDNTNLKQTLVPELSQDQQEYSSKLEAINDLKEVRETNAPSIYNEKLLDSMGYYDPDLLLKEKKRVVDSIYKSGKINYATTTYRKSTNKSKVIVAPKTIDTAQKILIRDTSAEELGLEHQLFFASAPLANLDNTMTISKESIEVVVDGNQVVKQDYRLRMRLSKEAIINNQLIPKNTPVYGFISFKTNRVMIEIENISQKAVSLKAFDLQDGSEGIYIENSFRADASKEIVGDIVDDINISGIPQISGVKQLFQRSNRNIKATVINNYKLILKTQL